MGFKIGDRVRLEHDHPDSIWVVMMVYEDTGRIGILHSTKDGSQMLWVNPSRLTLVDRYADLKQAIRDVLLSDEFLKAFAAAWVKTPLTHKSELDLSIEPITGSESEAYYLNKLKNGESK